MGVPPRPGSKDLGGRRFFIDGRWDRLGLPRLEQSPTSRYDDGPANQLPTKGSRSGPGNDSAPRDSLTRNPSAQSSPSSKPEDFESDSSSSSHLIVLGPSGEKKKPKLFQRTKLAVRTTPDPQPAPSSPTGPDVVDITMSDTENMMMNQTTRSKPSPKPSAKRKRDVADTERADPEGTIHSSSQHEENMVSNPIYLHRCDVLT